MAKALSELLEEGVAGRHVLVRSDLNVPLKDGVVTDDGRVRASLPVIEKLAKAGARVIVTAHLGRPKGKVDPQYSIAPAAARLAELASVPVKVATDLVGEDAKAKAAALADGEVLVVENVRYDARETSKDDAERGEFANELVALTGENGAYVNDAFGAVHRKHASVYDVAKRLPAYLGDLVKKEVDVLAKTLNDPERPFVVVMGGAKVSDKLAVIDNLIGKADTILIGGGMGYTFAYAQGYEVGQSLMENASESTIACATARVPSAKGAISNTPTGPFQKMVFAALIFSAKISRVLGPMSRPSASAPSLPPVRSSMGRISVLASAENASDQTTSTAVMISVPFSGASFR